MANEDFEEFEDVVVRSSPADQPGWADYAVAAVLGALFAGLGSLWSMPGVAPEVWENLAVAAKLRPAAAVAPGLWTALVGSLLEAVPLSAVSSSLHAAGLVVVGLSSGLVYLLFRSMLAVSVRLRLRFSRRRYFVVRAPHGIGAREEKRAEGRANARTRARARGN